MDLTGRRIRHYAILSRVGAGGMGEVWLAEDEALRRRVAIKVLQANAIGDPSSQRRFLREARAAAKLDHPNICAIHEIGELDNLTYIVLQYIEGETLAALLRRRGALPPQEAFDIAMQVAAALSEAHRHDVIHRDVKPENVMISARGQVKVLDFGLAKVTEPSDGSVEIGSLVSEAGLLIGTIPYMSPEQVRGEAVDPRTDIFSFGVMLFEMLAGRRPFTGTSSVEVLSSILTSDVPPLNTAPAAESLLRRALAKKREERYATIENLMRDLRRLGSHSEAAHEVDATTIVRPAPGSSRPKRRLRGLVIALLFCAALASAVFLVQRRSPTSATAGVPPAPTAPTANDLLVRARVKLSNESSENNQEAIRLLEQAVAADPRLAAAHAELARAYNIRAFYYAPRSERDALSENATVEVEKALALDPNLAEAHLARGLLLWTHENRFPHEQAIEEYRRAIALDPRLDEAHHQLGLVFFHIGLLDESRRELEQAVSLNRSNTLARFRIGVIDMYRAHYEDALRYFKSTPLKKNPSLWAFQTATALAGLGQTEEASALLDEYLAKYPADQGGVGTSVKAMVLAKAGKKSEALAAIARAVSIGEGFGHFHHTAYNVACAYALMRDPKNAVKWLQTAADDGFPCYPLFASDAALDPVRDDPAFQQLLARVKREYVTYRASYGTK